MYVWGCMCMWIRIYCIVDIILRILYMKCWNIGYLIIFFGRRRRGSCRAGMAICEGCFVCLFGFICFSIRILMSFVVPCYLILYNLLLILYACSISSFFCLNFGFSEIIIFFISILMIFESHIYSVDNLLTSIFFLVYHDLPLSIKPFILYFCIYSIFIPQNYLLLKLPSNDFLCLYSYHHIFLNFYFHC